MKKAFHPPAALRTFFSCLLALCLMLPLAPAQSVFAAEPVYHPGDVAAVNAIIANNGLGWAPWVSGEAPPESWRGMVRWSGDAVNKRVVWLITRNTMLSAGTELRGALDVTALTALQTLDCERAGSSGGGLTALNVAGLTALKSLKCGFNSLTSLDVSSLSALESLDCWYNSFSTLTVSGLPRLKTLNVNNNRVSMASLTVSNLPALEELTCHCSGTGVLNLSGLPRLRKLNCRLNGSLSVLDLSAMPALDELICDNININRLRLPGGYDMAVQCDSGFIRMEEFDYAAKRVTLISSAVGKNMGWSFTGFAQNPVPSAQSLTGSTVQFVLPQSPVTLRYGPLEKQPGPEAGPCAKLRISQSAVTLVAKKTFTPAAQAYGANGQPLRETLAWSSSKPKIATVNQNGKITAKAPGTAVVTVQAANGKRAKITVTVVKPGTAAADLPVKSVSANIPKTMQAGQTRAVTGKYAPAKAAGARLSFTSSKPAVLSADKTGTLTAKKKGKAVITVKAGRVSRKYTVTVR